jgi:hypothetical protein
MKKLLVGLFSITLASAGCLVASSAIAKDSHGSESHGNNSSHGTESRNSETHQSVNESRSRTADVPDCRKQRR